MFGPEDDLSKIAALEGFYDEFEKIATRAGVKQIRRLLAAGEIDKARSLAGNREAIRSKYTQPQRFNPALADAENPNRGISPRDKIAPRVRDAKGNLPPVIPGRLAHMKGQVKAYHQNEDVITDNNKKKRKVLNSTVARNPIRDDGGNIVRDSKNQEKPLWPEVRTAVKNPKGETEMFVRHDLGSKIKHLGQGGEHMADLVADPLRGLSVRKIRHEGVVTTPEINASYATLSQNPKMNDIMAKRLEDSRHERSGAHVSFNEYVPGRSAQSIAADENLSSAEKARANSEFERAFSELHNRTNVDPAEKGNEGHAEKYHIAGHHTADLFPRNFVMQRDEKGNYRGKWVDLTAHLRGTPNPRLVMGSGKKVRNAEGGGGPPLAHTLKSTFRPSQESIAAFRDELTRINPPPARKPNNPPIVTNEARESALKKHRSEMSSKNAKSEALKRELKDVKDEIKKVNEFLKKTPTTAPNYQALTNRLESAKAKRRSLMAS